jgi:hypothetical protein
LKIDLHIADAVQASKAVIDCLDSGHSLEAERFDPDALKAMARRDLGARKRRSTRGENQRQKQEKAPHRELLEQQPEGQEESAAEVTERRLGRVRHRQDEATFERSRSAQVRLQSEHS